MNNFLLIEEKLQQFIKKYYTNELIKGTILFTAIGLLYLFLILLIEYLFWLQPIARTILFWVFIAIEVLLLFRFILFPIFKLIGIQKGISQEEASKIIGKHFPKVNDKLLNILQLRNSREHSELLTASIEQKSKLLGTIPFTRAVRFSVNIKYLKYLILPIIIWILTLFLGYFDKLNQSLTRVVNHNVIYVQPAPFKFHLNTPNLKVIQGKPVTIDIDIVGELIPEDATIHFNDQVYFMENKKLGQFTFTFDQINKTTKFYIEANTIQSIVYTIEIISTPNIRNVSVELKYPSYIRRKNEILPHATNLTVPRGTSVSWKVTTSQTDTVKFSENSNKTAFFNKDSDSIFSYQRKILDDINYSISTSNQELIDYEKLQFSVNAISDRSPNISVVSNIDSVSRGPVFFAGRISDDYGFSKLEMVYYDIQNPINQYFKTINITSEPVQSFFSSFPDDLNLQEGTDYEIFFRIFDNDAINGTKSSSSKKFSYRKKTTAEIENELLQEQQNYLENIQNAIDNQQKNKQELEKLQFDLRNKQNMNWSDQNKIKDLINRQQQYEKIMQRQTEKLQENFSEKKEENENLQEKKEQLQNRIQELKKLEKQKKLLDEIKKMAEKLNKEDLLKKSKALAQQNKQQQKSLERVLELAKRYYVEQKMNQISEKLNKLSKKQDDLAEIKNSEEDKKEQYKENGKETKKTSKNKNSLEEQKEAQDAIKKDFNKIKKDFDNLKKDNEKLKQPLDLPKIDDLEKETEEELNKAKEHLQKNNREKAKQNQKKASKKMQEMGEKMQQSMEIMSNAMEAENIEDLRNVVENLITFSFNQENLMEWYYKSDTSHPAFGEKLRKQNELKTYFEHIDDSLYVLSMRVPKISAKIQEHLATAHYNLDLSLENFSESRFRRGTSNQRYVMTATNELVNMLSNTLDAMQNPKPGSGSGKGKKGESFSLPDIIQQQKGLTEQMKQGIQKKGQQGKPDKGKQGGEGDPSEDLDGTLYQIYQEQAKLRQQIENAIKKGGTLDGNTKNVLNEMEQLENKILEGGFNQNTLNRMQKLSYELLKLDTATFEQGKEKKRKSKTNIVDYNTNKAKELQFKKLYYKQTEILNRQNLPLKKDYKKKVQEYFNKQEL